MANSAGYHESPALTLRDEDREVVAELLADLLVAGLEAEEPV
jgi:hypothetical protein